MYLKNVHVGVEARAQQQQQLVHAVLHLQQVTHRRPLQVVVLPETERERESDRVCGEWLVVCVRVALSSHLVCRITDVTNC